MGRQTSSKILCDSEGCADLTVFHLSWIEQRRSKREQHLCEKHGNLLLANRELFKSSRTGPPAIMEGARCIDIAGIVISQIHDQQVIYLQEVAGERYFPLLIGIFEATTLDRVTKGFRAPRPLTHDAMFNAIHALNGVIEDVIISSLKDHTYYTNLHIRQLNQMVTVDVRPSDAFVLAVLANRPIFIADEVLLKIDL
jgi:bifunctional DNase/RNase